MPAVLPGVGIASPADVSSAPVKLSERQLLLWLVASVIVLSGCLIAPALYYLRAQALESAQRLTESFAQVIEEQTQRTLQAVNQSLQLTADGLAQMKQAGTLTDDSARHYLNQQLQTLPFARVLWVTDANGRLQYDTQVGHLGFDLSQTSHFKALKANPQIPFLIGGPVKGRIDGQWLVPAVRPLLTSNGEFAGTIVASVDPLYFDKLWRSVDLGADGSVALFRRDGLLVMRSPFNEPSVGKRFDNTPLFTQLLTHSPHGRAQIISPIDGMARLMSYRTLAAQPDLIVVVGQSTELALQHWQRFAMLVSTVWFAGAMGIGLLCFNLNRAWRQRALMQARAAQAAERLQLATDAAEVGIWDWDISSADQWFASPTYFTMLGYEPVSGMADRTEWLARVHPDDRAAVQDRIQAVLTGDDPPYDYEARMLHANGSYRWVSVVGRVLARDAHGKTRRLIGVRMDVTARKQAQLALQHSEARYRALFEYAPDGILIADKDSTYLDANTSICRMLGYTYDELVGLHATDIVVPEELAHIDTALVEIRSHTGHHREWRFRRKDGSSFAAEVLASEMPDGNLMAVIRDVTERNRAQEALRESAAHTQTILDNMVDAVVTFDDQGHIESFNRAASATFGYAAPDIVGKSANLLIDDPDSHFEQDYLRHRFSSVGQGIASLSQEVQGRRKDGSKFPAHLSISKTYRNGQALLIAILRDITQQRHDEEEIRRLAFFDPLTGLPNRRLLMDRLKQAMATSARTGKHGALMFLDLDHFKLLNDSQGHDVGDLLLQQTAARLTACVRDGDSVARLGGDEFVVLLEALSAQPHDAATQAEAVANKLLEAFVAPYTLNGYSHEGTTSIGIVVFLGDAEPMDDLLKKADLAMYQGKAAGRNTARFFDPAMQAAVTEHDAQERDLRRGIAMREFVLYYQVQVDNRGRPIGAETLVRWNHGRRGLIPPGQFIVLAEQTGLILNLGQQVLEMACVQLANWAGQSERAHWTLAVNVSAAQFAQASFVANVAQALAQAGANPRLLKLELTESILVHDVEDVVVKMGALKAMGIGFSLDDFGTGYSSLSYLKRLPLDQLKIDQSFVRDVLTDPSDAVIARTILALGHSLGLSVIAEGVETAGQHAFLAEAGCDAFQGYLFGYPGPAEALP